MKPAVIIGIILAIIGVAALGYEGFTYTTREKVVDMGPIQISKDTKHRLPLSPILGGLALAGGVVLIVTGSKKS